MKKIVNISFFLSGLNSINSEILNKDSKIFINYIEFCNFKDNLNLDIKNSTMKANEFLNLFKNDTYKTPEICGKSVDIKLSDCKFKILWDLNNFNSSIEIEDNNQDITIGKANEIKGLLCLKDYRWPKDKIIYSIAYGDKKKKVVEFKNNVDIKDIFESPKKQKHKISNGLIYILYSLKDKFVKDSQKCDFPEDETGIKDIIIKTKSEEIKLEDLGNKKYEITFLELVDKAVKDNTLEYVKIILSTNKEYNDIEKSDENKKKCKCSNS